MNVNVVGFFCMGLDIPLTADVVTELLNSRRPGSLIVPTITIYQVFKAVVVSAEKVPLCRRAALMQQGKVGGNRGTACVAMLAARMSEPALPMADSIIPGHNPASTMDPVDTGRAFSKPVR